MRGDSWQWAAFAGRLDGKDIGVPSGGVGRSALRQVGTRRLHLRSPMGDKCRWSEAIVATVHVRDGNSRQLFVLDVVEAAEVDPVHRADGRLGSYTEGTDAAVPAEVVDVLPRVEHVSSQLGRARQQSKSLGCRDRRPEARSAADRAVATIGFAHEVEVSLERHRSTVAAAAVGLQHQRPFSSAHPGISASTSRVRSASDSCQPR